MAIDHWKRSVPRLLERWVYSTPEQEHKETTVRRCLRLFSDSFTEEEILWLWMEDEKETRTAQRYLRRTADYEEEIKSLQKTISNLESRIETLQQSRNALLDGLEKDLTKALQDLRNS